MTIEELYRTVAHDQQMQLLDKMERVEWNGEAEDIPIRYMHCWVMQIYPATVVQHPEQAIIVATMDYINR